jgi:hypothetical protein
MSLTIINIV